MKKLSILIVRSFLGPFLLTTLISLFVLVMQFLWKHIEDLAGKGLKISLILEFLFYASATLIPMALPLGMLFSSIMTMGSFAENLELVASKSAGISLMRTMRPLFLFAVVLSIIAFMFANYAMPVANFKLRSLITKIQKESPAIDIPEREFYDGIKGLTVFVEEKEKDQRTLRNVTIYDHNQEQRGNSTVMTAETGVVGVTDDGNFLTFTLFNGAKYHEQNFYGDRTDGLKFFRETFSEQEVIIDLRKLKQEGNSVVRNQYSMMDLTQLNKVYQETEMHYMTYVKGQAEQATRYFGQTDDPNGRDPTQSMYMESGPLVASILNDSTFKRREIPRTTYSKGQVLDTYTADERRKIAEVALGDAQNHLKKTKDQMNQQRSTQGTLARNKIEYHRKFSLSVACLLLFFVGAPLGAIIRKGGLGLPLIFSIVIFIVYYVISTIGEKAVRNLAMDAFTGMWLSSLILAPFALLLTLMAGIDSPIFVADTYTQFFRRIFGKSRA